MANNLKPNRGEDKGGPCTVKARTREVKLREESKETDEEKCKKALESMHRMDWLKRRNDASTLQRSRYVRPMSDQEGPGNHNQSVYGPRIDLRHSVDEPKNDFVAKPEMSNPNRSSRMKHHGFGPQRGGFMKDDFNTTKEKAWDTSSSRYVRPMSDQEGPGNHNQSVYGPRIDLRHSVDEPKNDFVAKPEMSNPNRFSRMKPHGFGQLRGGFMKDDFNTTKEKAWDTSSSRYVRPMSDQEGPGNHNQSVYGPRIDLRHSVDEPKNDFVAKPEMSNPNRFSRMKPHGFGQLRGGFMKDDFNTTKEKAWDTSSDGQSGSKGPKYYFNLGREMSAKRARERAIMFAATKAEEEKKEMTAEPAFPDQRMFTPEELIIMEPTFTDQRVFTPEELIITEPTFTDQRVFTPEELIIMEPSQEVPPPWAIPELQSVEPGAQEFLSVQNEVQENMALLRFTIALNNFVMSKFRSTADPMPRPLYAGHQVVQNPLQFALQSRPGTPFIRQATPGRGRGNYPLF